MQSSKFDTRGLPELLKRLDVPVDGAPPPSHMLSIVIIGILHVVGIFLLIIAAAVSADAASFTNSNFLMSGDAPGAFVALNAMTVILFIFFSILSAVDASYYLCTNVAVTAGCLSAGLLTVTLVAGNVVFASLALTSTVFWLEMIALICAVATLSVQLATILSILVHNNNGLLLAIRQSI